MNSRLSQFRRPDGFYSFRLRPCPTAILKSCLDGCDGVVWVTGHFTDRAMRWHRLPIHLAPNRPQQVVAVRGLQYDLCIDVPDFIPCLEQFDGGSFFCMTKPVPDSLVLEAIPPAQQYLVLAKNGMRFHFTQPHSHESALFVASESEAARLLSHAGVLPYVDWAWCPPDLPEG
jgi:hypothetical protein